ncbi:NfeD family protein [Massilia violaceinigra]|uniref:NfeD family protein n=1 Tax=Massilia violaceinigra TaxID=2045208 RepID=A0A2D2DP46_9BURK|nr:MULTISPECIES: NfeD family protein [Massilia]ATQ76763.1 NfeD family protein [Massilia violaceinigra]MDQ1920714.1 NfeD family protein [Massilia sp. CCM 9206]
MADWTWWLALAGALVIFELFTGTFYILMIAVGVACGAIAALMGYGPSGQLLTAAVVGVIATGLLHRSRFGAPGRQNTARDPNVNMDIGQSVNVDTWSEGKARVMYRGAPWDVELGPGALAEAGSFRIVEVQGSRLIVSNK